MTEIKWQPSNPEETTLWTFMHACGFEEYKSLHHWSIERRDMFWENVWDFCGVIGDKGDIAYEPSKHIKDDRFFPQAKLNYAENLLRRRDDDLALIFQGEDKAHSEMSYKELYEQVSQMEQALREMNIQKGDRVAGFLPNLPQTIIAMLATASIGAVWSSASPDFGVQGVLDRFEQVEPKLLITVDGYHYNGKIIDCRIKNAKIMSNLPSLTHAIEISYVGLGEPAIPSWDEVLEPYTPKEIEFTPVCFNHPLFIMFSSGTTGVPKCIIHGVGGTLLQHLKEHQLHSDINKDDRAFYFTTCGWMMWNWLVTGLASGACLMLYDGSPMYPDGNVLFDFVDKHKATFFGTSAKFLDALNKAGYKPKETHDLSSLKTIASTGSPLVHEGFDYVYDDIKSDVHLASISGGTDIVSCFVLGNPISPVYRGEIQSAGLGMDIDVFDADGHSLPSGAGELVCKVAFPSMPIGFWKDDDGQRYHDAYFNSFDNIWSHGDWCSWTEHGGMIIHGRSDATLNPGGVRIGTAEIYRQVEKLTEIKESIVVGQDWEGDTRVVLFVIMQDGASLSDDLIAKIRKTVREGASPRHMPAKIIAVNDIPRTKSGKITELAVKNIVHGRPVQNTEALANPEALSLYKNLEELQN